MRLQALPQIQSVDFDICHHCFLFDLWTRSCLWHQFPKQLHRYHHHYWTTDAGRSCIVMTLSLYSWYLACQFQQLQPRKQDISPLSQDLKPWVQGSHLSSQRTKSATCNRRNIPTTTLVSDSRETSCAAIDPKQNTANTRSRSWFFHFSVWLCPIFTPSHTIGSSHRKQGRK